MFAGSLNFGVTSQVLDSVNSSPKDAPVPDGLNTEEKRKILGGVLDRRS